jgi:hypothetical protein
MITVMKSIKSGHGDAFTLKISEPGTGWRGFSAEARNIGEVITAIQHYYGHAPHGVSPDSSCPLCRLSQREKGGD